MPWALSFDPVVVKVLCPLLLPQVTHRLPSSERASPEMTAVPVLALEHLCSVTGEEQSEPQAQLGRVEGLVTEEGKFENSQPFLLQAREVRSGTRLLPVLWVCASPASLPSRLPPPALCSLGVPGCRVTSECSGPSGSQGNPVEPFQTGTHPSVQHVPCCTCGGLSEGGAL